MLHICASFLHPKWKLLLTIYRQCQGGGNNSFHSLYWDAKKGNMGIIYWNSSIWREKPYSENASSPGIPAIINNTTSFRNHCEVEEKLRSLLLIDRRLTSISFFPPSYNRKLRRKHIGPHGLHLELGAEKNQRCWKYPRCWRRSPLSIFHFRCSDFSKYP